MNLFLSFFSAAARAIVAFLAPILKRRAGEILAVALPIAQGIVADLAKRQLPSEQKRSEAVSQLREALVSAGYSTATEVSGSLLNLAVEMAVQRLK